MSAALLRVCRECQNQGLCNATHPSRGCSCLGTFWGPDFMQYHDLNCAFPRNGYEGYVWGVAGVHALAFLVVARSIRRAPSKEARGIALLTLAALLANFGAQLSISLQRGYFEGAAILFPLFIVCVAHLVVHTMDHVLAPLLAPSDLERVQRRGRSARNWLGVALLGCGVAIAFVCRYPDPVPHNSIIYIQQFSIALAAPFYGIAVFRALGRSLAAGHVESKRCRSLRRETVGQFVPIFLGNAVPSAVHAGLGSLPWNGLTLLFFNLFNACMLTLIVARFLSRTRLFDTKRADVAMREAALEESKDVVSSYVR